MTGGRETRQAGNATEQSVRHGMYGDADPPGLAPDRRQCARSDSGLPVNIIAIVWTGAMMVDLLWPRPATSPAFHGLRVSVWLIGVPPVIGIIYYAAVQHRRLAIQETDSAQLPATTPDLSS